MITIGAGQTGMKLALMFNKDPVLISTALQDTQNFSGQHKVISVSEDGASKRFRTGEEIWERNEGRLRAELENIVEQDVIMFSSLGGGSGSSSLLPVSKILLEQGCRILIAGVVPFKKEVNPPLANSVQAINSLMEIIDKVSVILFDNEKLIKQFDGEWADINEHIVQQVDYIVNLLSKYTTQGYSPVTLDQSELESVVFGGGFVDISSDFVEEKVPKFEYGKLDKSTKNCLIAMFVDKNIRDTDAVDEYQNILTDVIRKYGTKVSNARMIPGILRANINFTNAEDETITDRCYITIASGLSVDRYMTKVEKLRDDAIKKAQAFAERQKSEKVIGKKEGKILDI